jgi:uncharacterized protein
VGFLLLLKEPTVMKALTVATNRLANPATIGVCGMKKPCVVSDSTRSTNARPSRRDFIKSSLGGVALFPQVQHVAQAVCSQPAEQHFDSPIVDAPKIFIEPFNYQGVRLLDGRLKTQYQTARDYYYAIPSDDMLKGFRQRYGLPAPGNDLGGWYSGDPTQRTWWSLGDTFHVFGQWLSAMARMSRATNDDAMGIKAGHLMIEWGRAIDPDGFFFYSRRPSHPHYIYEKTVCGLVDLYEFGGRRDAEPLLEKITDWAIEHLDRERKPDTGTEWYTLCENLYRAYLLTGNPKYKTFGDVWRYTPYWESFVGGDFSPYHRHAYSHVNTLSSAAMTYAVTGDPKFLNVIVNAYDWLEKTQFYATGGYGPDERTLPPDGSLGESLAATEKSFETPCGSWAGFKLARYLMRFTGEAKYGDWMEFLIYNGVGAALPMGPHGKTFYYSDYRLGGGRKIYYPDATWPCCSGTLPQALADYHNIIYFKDAAGLYVNMFVPSDAAWIHNDREIKVEQETDFPEADTTNLTVRTSARVDFDLKFRVPRWAKGANVKVNGVEQSIDCRPGTWAVIRRTWNSGDRVSLQFPMQLRLLPIDPQHPNRVALMFGPVVLVRNQDPILIPKGTDPSAWVVPQGGPLQFSAPAQPHGAFLPFYKVPQGTPYSMYFELQRV